MKNIAVVTGYIMYYDMLKDKINGSFFSKIDRAVEIAELFCSFYSAEETARKQKKGIHKYKFTNPQQYRRTK
jgi:hypothetical protein